MNSLQLLFRNHDSTWAIAIGSILRHRRTIPFPPAKHSILQRGSRTELVEGNYRRWSAKGAASCGRLHCGTRTAAHPGKEKQSHDSHFHTEKLSWI